MEKRRLYFCVFLGHDSRIYLVCEEEAEIVKKQYEEKQDFDFVAQRMENIDEVFTVKLRNEPVKGIELREAVNLPLKEGKTYV